MKEVYKIINTTDHSLIGKQFTINADGKSIDILGITDQQPRSCIFETVRINGDFVTLINSNFTIKGRRI